MTPNQDRAVQAAFDGYVPASELAAARAEIEQLQAALKECAQASYLDEHDLVFRPTREALIARHALEQKA